MIDEERERRRQTHATARAISREVLDRTAHIKVTPHDPTKEDALEHWVRLRERSQPARAPRQPTPTARDLELLRAGQWDAYVNAKIEAALAGREWEIAALREAVGAVVGQTRAQLRKEFSETVAALRADLTIASAHSDTVIDLPRFLQKARDAA